MVRTGEGVTGWSAGDRAALEPAIYCYHCEFCRAGRHNICANIRFLSNPGYPGFFREFVNLPAANLLAIPPEMSLELATVVGAAGRRDALARSSRRSGRAIRSRCSARGPSDC